MENKKLVKILLKDMTDLEEMIADVKNRGEFDAMEMEILHTRSKGVLQLLQLLNGMELTGVVQKMPVRKAPEELKPTATDKPEKKDELKSQKEEKIPVEDLEEDIHEEKQVESVNEITEEKKEEKESVKKKEEGIKEIKKEDTGSETNVEKENNNDVELEEEEVTEANQRLGDSFLKGKSVNDILTDQNKLEFKLSNRPVVSIQSAIGINDRFQYIRELFDGSNEKFTQTVSDLDKMDNIKEAVKYLQQNFKWKKNETSLKFVNLIKRRFPND